MVAAQETNLQKILEGTSQYLVPLYQRPYQWGPDNFKELWRDITQLAEDRLEDIETTHFIGSVVLAPVPGGVAGSTMRYLVVDGQQRLTTLTLLLAAIRDHLRETEGTTQRESERIDHQLLTNRFVEAPFYLKFLPTQADRESYAAVIDTLPTAGGDDAIGGAYRFFRARLAEPVDPDTPYDTVQLAQAVTLGLSVVSISTHPGDNVHRIFQSLNNTGLKLTQGDLLRNYLFMRLPTRSEEVYRTQWLPLQKALVDNERIETLFWLDLLHTKPQVKQGQTFAGQQARLDRLTTEDEVVAEIERIARLGRLYRLMIHPSEESDQAVRERLERLAAWDSTTPAPLILFLLSLRDRGRATSDQVARALLFIESLLVRRFLIGRATQGLNRLFPAAVQELDASLPVDEALHRYLSEGRKHYATNETLTEAIANSPLYTTGRAAQRKTIMIWIEQLFASKEPVSPDSLTIEHIMPQTLSAQWRSELSAAYGAENVDDLHDRLVHTLGNLTLSGYNENLSNHEFARKRETLRASSIRMNQEVARHSAWGPKQIEQRGRELAQLIIAAWPGPTATVHERKDDNPLWHKLNRLLVLLPAGHWTTYGDLAKVLGTAAQPLGNRLATIPAPNAHRVLTAQGEVAAGFRWIEAGRTDDPARILEQEGVRFLTPTKADPSRRLTVADLERLRSSAEDDQSGPD
ncbi:GmrSD restriction endonuclease domain-containing protein [Nocardia takedensis]